MNIVPRVSTPQSLESIAETLRDAFAVEAGRPLDATTAELLTAQILIETREGQSIKNNSPGNISASSKWGGDAWRPPWFALTETSSARDRELHEAMLANKAPSAFRSFPTFDAGMRDYVRTLLRQFPSIVQARTPGELARAIFDSGYTRDHKPEAIEPTLAGLVGKVRSSGVYDDLAPSPVPPVSVSPKAAAPALDSSSPRPALSYSYAAPPELQRGVSSPLVAVWQGFVGAKPDGLFGPATEERTRAWQARNGLPVTGRVGESDWARGVFGSTPPAWSKS